MCWGHFKDTSSWAEGSHPAMHMGTRVKSSDTPEHHQHGRQRPQECVRTGSKLQAGRLAICAVYWGLCRAWRERTYVSQHRCALGLLWTVEFCSLKCYNSMQICWSALKTARLEEMAAKCRCSKTVGEQGAESALTEPFRALSCGFINPLGTWPLGSVRLPMQCM